MGRPRTPHTLLAPALHAHASSRLFGFEASMGYGLIYYTKTITNILFCKRRRRPTDRPGAVRPGAPLPHCPWVVHATLQPGAITSEAGVQADTSYSLRFNRASALGDQAAWPLALWPGDPGHWGHATLRPGAITSEAGLQADTEDSLRFGPPWPFGLN